MLDFKYEKIPRQDICPAKNCQNGGSFFKSHVMIMMGKKPIPYFHEYQAIDIHNHRRNLMAPYNQVPFTVEMQVVFFNSNLNNAVYCEKSAISNIFDKHLLIPKQNEIVSLCDLVIKYGCAIGYIIPDFYKRYLDEYKKIRMKMSFVMVKSNCYFVIGSERKLEILFLRL